MVASRFKDSLAFYQLSHCHICLCDLEPSNKYLFSVLTCCDVLVIVFVFEGFWMMYGPRPVELIWRQKI